MNHSPNTCLVNSIAVSIPVSSAVFTKYPNQPQGQGCSYHSYNVPHHSNRAAVMLAEHGYGGTVGEAIMTAILLA